MNDRRFADQLVRESPAVRSGDSVAHGVRALLASGLPALPVVDSDERLCGLFGEREFLTALFPGYLQELHHAGFVPRSLEQALDKRADCSGEPIDQYMNTEHVEVGASFSDAQVAEIFLHHRVLIVPVVERGRVAGIITRSDFFRAVAGRFLGEA